MGSRIPDFSLPSVEDQFKRVREMIRCFPEQDDYKRATIDLMSPVPTILSLSDLFFFLDSLQRTSDVMKLSHDEASNHHVGGGGKKDKLINENTVIKDRDASRPLVAASPSSPPLSEQKCRACGRDYGPGHRDVCPARDKTCNDCGRKGHFAGNDYCPMKKQKKPPVQPSVPPSTLKKSQPKAGPVVSEEDKKKAARGKKIAAVIKLLEEEVPTALSVPVPPPPPHTYHYQGQGQYPSAQQMLPSPYYSTLAPPPPTYRPTEEEKRVVRFDPRGPDPNAPTFPAFFRRPTGMLDSLPPTSLASFRSSLAPPLVDYTEEGGGATASSPNVWETRLGNPVWETHPGTTIKSFLML